MSKLSARDIQVFVAGVLAYLGFDSLVWAPDAFIHSQAAFGFINLIVGGAALLLGVALIAGSARALLWVQIILWLGVIQDVISICVFAFREFGISLNVPHMSLYRAISSFLTLSALLWLIAWSRSRRFRHEPDA